MFKRSCEEPNKIYVSLFGIRLIFEDGKFAGWYHYRKGPQN